MQTKYKRIVLNISGEALAGEKHFGLDGDVVSGVVDQIVKVHNMGVEVALVIGAGNFWRGRQGAEMERTTADMMGMLATVMNSLAMMDAIEKKGVPARVMTSLNMVSVAEPYTPAKAVRHLEKGRVVIIAGGTGNPFFTTDTAAVLRACEVGADALLMAKNVDGIYDSDPRTNPKAKKYDKISFRDIIAGGLKAMDITAATMCMENNLPVLAFALNESDSVLRVSRGEHLGTLILSE